MNKYLLFYQNYESTEVGIVFADTEEKALIKFCVENVEELGSLTWFFGYWDIDNLKDSCKRIKDINLLRDYISIVDITNVKNDCILTSKYVDGKHVSELKDVTTHKKLSTKV